MSDPRVRRAAGRRRCAQITRRNGTTYYWGTLLLPPDQRRDVYGVYALCRLADDIVDEPQRVDVVDLAIPHDATPADRLDAFESRFRQALCAGDDEDAVMAAIVATVRRRDIPLHCFDRFFTAMRLDLVRDSWQSWEELRDVYMEGSAAVIGEMMLPVLQPSTPAALGPARALGLAFQLTNFIRDVGEDLDRGRVYLPAEDLARFGADPWARRVTPAWRAFLADQIARNRRLYEEAERGVPMLPLAAARCVGAALRMYSTILTRIEEADYDVFTQRRRVSSATKTIIAADVLARGTGVAMTMPAARSVQVLPESGRHAPSGGLRRRLEAIPVKRVPQPEQPSMRSTWRQASVPRIERALAVARSKDPGGWYVLGASTDVGHDRSIVRTVAGREVALWRDDDGRLHAGPGACPHMGARLHDCVVDGSTVLCRWHGMALPAPQLPAWSPYPARDDGVLLWVRLPTAGEIPSAEPALPARPPLTEAIASVYARPGTCEPWDIIANRLDPWHGAWLHPYAFSHLVVDEQASSDDLLVTDVTFRLGRTWGVPVRAQFSCPDARTIVMHIVEGEGAGSVVETHATPIGLDRGGHPVTMMVETTIASSSRPGFRAAQRAAALVRPLMRRSQQRLWVDDMEYAQRRYFVRHHAAAHGPS